MNRRGFLFASFAATLLARPGFAASGQVLVFKSPTCGCCAAWVTHMQQAGFTVESRDVSQQALGAIKAQAGVPRALSSCHTAFVDGYFIEGHVPAPDVARLLSERPGALGLTVPGMPIGSPGMEMGDRRDPFDSLLVLKGGGTQVFQTHL